MTKPAPRLTPRTDTSPGKPLRISNVAIYGIPIEKEFTRTSAPILSVSIVQDQKTEFTCALVDSGCEGYAFIDREYAKSVGLALRSILRPFSLYGYDGEERDSRMVREYVRCDIKNGDHVDKNVVLYATPLSHYPIVLGDPWLKKHNPRTNWADGSWEFSDPYCLQNCNTTRHPTRQKTLVDVPKQYIPELNHRDIARVSLNACRAYARRGYQMGMVTIEDIDAALQQEGDELEIQLPEALRDFVDVFSPKKADKLPPHRSYDHEIRLTSDKKLPFGRIYSMSREELQTLRNWLDENLKKGFIRPSSSPVTSPVLFVKKPGGGLRLCMDFRALNEISVKDRYPLPLIKETLNNLDGMKYFTKIDIISAFNNVRMKEGHEKFTAFLTRFGLFESLVMPFGLTGAPATFQRFINDALREYLDRFCSAYLDDILIYSKTKKEHLEHVRKVLERLRQAGLYAKLSKCEFFVAETKFLGLIVGKDGFKMDPEKVKTILDWNTPKNATDVLRFNGFCNFYRRFIRDYSKIVTPLIDLTKKNAEFNWSVECQDAFEKLKATVASAPVLKPFDWTKEAILETDASDFVSAGVLSQYDNEGILRPVAFFSKKHSAVECNYEIYDKELLAIIRCLEEWRPELEGTETPVRILSDHRNLEYFMSTKMLNRRQARWSEFLSRYNFRIVYRPGKQGEKPDALTRRSEDLPKEGDERLQHQSRIVLKKENFEDLEMPPTLPKTPESGQTPTEPQEMAQLKMRKTVRFKEDLTDTILFSAMTVESVVDDTTEIKRLLRSGCLEDENIASVLRALEQGKNRHPFLQLAQCQYKDRLLYYREKIYVPEFEDLRVKIIRQHHDNPSAGHPGRAKTFELLSRNYCWKGMSTDVRQYVLNCRTCGRIKARHDRHQGLLQPLPVPERSWQHISVDFITHLPLSNGYDAVLVVVDRLTKMRHYVPCLMTSNAEDVARMFVRDIYRLHGAPASVVSDRDIRFVNNFWDHLSKRLQLSTRMTVAHRPEGDGQTERLNAILEQHLRAYVSYLQDDWVDWLPLAEFSANSLFSETTGMSPFFANYGFHPRLGVEPVETIDAPAARQASAFADHMSAILTHLREQTILAQARYEEASNKSRATAPRFSVGQKVWLSAKNLKTLRPRKKLDWKNIGPFQITDVLGPYTYRLDLPDSMPIHPVFNVDQLYLVADDPLPGQLQEPPPPVFIEGTPEYEVAEVQDCRRRGKGYQYLVRWTGYDDPTLEPARMIYEDVPELVRNFHRRYRDRPVPPFVR